MAQLSRRLFSIAPRLLLAGVIAGFCYLVFRITLLSFVVLPLLNSGNTTKIYIGFYLEHPSIVGKASNLRCVTDGFVSVDALDRYVYYCRFNMKPLNVKQFVKGKGLKFGKLAGTFGNECVPSHMDVPINLDSSPARLWWNPEELEADSGVQCYSIGTHELLYSPASQTAYMRDSYD
ncbi:hypothetical protein [Trichocoleus sp. FACHB-262]|uniref:hypothetical protein n=1 Tax=Trichocoleus sp. FACHB-262 TaxID=2692869 RepID=UPI0016883D96|nr:hypothetical protein [Trichocoleus sp. FACHB-262]MBD2119340.1 hypothetical protein [Trichocoleus sp. FACHB-262]